MKKRLLITSIVMMLVVAVALSTATYAWFSSNKSVKATGMTVKANSSASLVITNDNSKINSEATNTATFTVSEVTALTPATHLNGQKDASNQDIEYDKNNGDSYLVYVTNPNDVDAVSGVAATDKTLAFAKATNEEDAPVYFVDFTVYIASKGDALANHDLEATINYTSNNEMPTLYNAISIDYWVDGDYVITDSFADRADAETLILNDSIPSAAAQNNNYITVLMRVYFDGALMNGEVAYVNNGAINVSDVQFSVSFTATENEAVKGALAESDTNATLNGTAATFKQIGTGSYYVKSDATANGSPVYTIGTGESPAATLVAHKHYAVA